MDEQMCAILKSQGWSESLGRDSKGRPYWAWARDGAWFHVVAHSHGAIVDTQQSYGDGRAAQTVTHEVKR